MRARRWSRFCLWLLLVASATAQTGTPSPTTAPPPPPVEGEDSDPTRPVVWSVREEFYKLRGDDWANVLIVRKDKAFLKNQPRWGGKRGILTRFDLPMTVASRAGVTQGGLGDLYLQVLYVPYLTRKLAFVGGTGILLPTATDRFLGTGKLVVAPAVAGVWFIPKRGFFLLKFQDYVSVAGDTARPDLHYLTTTPLLVWRFKRKWWTQLDGETKTHFEAAGRTAYKAGALLGRMFNGKTGASVKVEVPFGGYREGDVTIKLSLIRVK